MRSLRLTVPAVSLVTLLVACGGDDVTTLDIPAECNPLGGGACLAPWPPAAYLAKDEASPTGWRLAFPAGAVPKNGSGVAFDPAAINGRTGYSPATQIIAHFGVALDDGNLVHHGDLARSVTAESPTVILDAASGELVAHFAELDANVNESQLDQQALYLRPAARLGAGRRYIVAIKKTLKAAGGGEVPVPPGFAAIVSGQRTDHAPLEAMRPRQEEVLDQLESYGLARGDLLVAWDFVTASDDELRADLLAARDAALAVAGANGANLQLHDVVIEPNPRAGIAKKVTFLFDAPTVRDDGGLLRDAAGKATASGTSQTRGVALIPTCATTEAKVGITVFGHGFFGGIEESGGGYLQGFAARGCRVIIGADWRGMSTPDSPDAILAMGDLNKAFPFGERIAQGIIDMVALTQLARGKLATDVLVDDQQQSVVDPADITFYGISQGHILGSTFYAIDPVLRRGVLHVGGANWSVLFERSINWAVLGLPLKGAYEGPLNAVLMEQVLQMALDVIDPIHWAPTVAGPGTTGKQYLLYASKGDAQVTNLATYLQARTMQIPVVTPSVEMPYGLTQATGTPMSALVIVDEKPSPLPPETNLLNERDNEAHENPRRREKIMDQIEAFLDTGAITPTCGGETAAPCDCTTGACGALAPF